MAKFPIKHAEKGPPGFGPSVRANLDVRTGEPEMWGQVARAGGRLAAFASKIEQAEDVVGYAQTKLEIDGLRDAYLGTLQTTTDPEAVAQLREKAEGEMLAVPKTERGTAYGLAQVSHIRGETIKFTTMRRAANVEIEGRAALQAFLEKGDREGYGETLAGLVGEGAIPSAEGVILLQNFDTQSLLVRADMQIRGGDPTQVRAAMGQLGTLKTDGLSQEQLEELERLRRAGAQKLKIDSNEMIREVLVDMDKNQNMLLVDRPKTAAEYRQKVLVSGASPAEMRAMSEWIDKWETGEDAETDLVVYSDLNKRVSGLTQDSTPEDVAGITQEILDEAGKTISATHAKALLDDVENRLEKAVADAVNYAVDRAEQAGVDSMALRRELVSQIHKEKLPLDQIVPRGAALVATMPRVPAKDTFAQKWIETKIGAMRAYARATKLPERQALETEEYVSEMFGLGWYQNPRLVAARLNFIRLFPLRSWHYQSPQEQQATVDWIRGMGWRAFGWMDIEAKGLDIVEESDRDEIVDDITTAGPLTPEQSEKVGKYLEGKYGADNVPKPVELAPSAETTILPVPDLPIRASTQDEVESLPPGTQYFWKDETVPRVKQ